MKRNLAIDYEKGIAVALMVFTHVLNFFGDAGTFPEQRWITFSISALAFPTFLFSYGRSVYLAYYKKSFRAAAPRMLMAALRLYLAFVICAVAYNTTCLGQPFRLPMILKVAQLKDIPGMADFLASYAVFGLLALILFPALRWLLEHRRLFWLVTAAFFFSVLIPHSEIREARLGLLIGTGRYNSFSVVHYFPYFLAGLYVSRHGMNKKLIWIGATAVMTGLAVAYTVKNGEPRHFPPDLMWLFLPCLAIVLLDILAEAINRLTAARAWTRKVFSPIEAMGRNSLYYVVSHNMVLFVLSNLNNNGVQILPAFYAMAKFPFTLRLRSTPWALFWSLALLVCIGIVSGMNRKPARENPAKEPPSGKD